MADTIEAFVEKLKAEGVEEGRREADQIRSEASKEADQILADAKREAEKAVAQAGVEADSIVARGRTELELAARDAVLKLHQSLEQALQAVLVGPVEAILNDAEFLRELIRSAALRYIEADVSGSVVVTVDVSPEMLGQLADWAMSELRRETSESGGGVDLRGELRQAGFEVSFRGATIEITRESVVETLMQLVSPSLREILNRASRVGEGD